MKKISLALIASSLVVATLSGCSNVGNKSLKDVSESQVQQMIVTGKTTQSEVKAQFGSPMKTSFTDGGLAIWTYQFDDVTAFTPETVASTLLTFGLAGTKARGTRNELVVLFDKENVVKQFNMSNSPIEAGTGVF